MLKPQKIDLETLSKYRKLRLDNLQISGIHDFFNDFILNILEKENKSSFKKDDFEKFKSEFENIKLYNDILIKNGINISIEKTKIFILGQSLDEFINFIKSHKVKDLITYGKIENIKLFFGKDFFNIKTKDDLLELFNINNYNRIKAFIDSRNIENIKLFFGKDGIIKNLDNLLEIIKHTNCWVILDIINLKTYESIKLFFGEDFFDIKTKDDLLEIINNTNSSIIIELINFKDTENIKLFFGEDFFDIKTKDDLLAFIKNKNSFYIIKLINNLKIENIKLFFGKEGIIKNLDNLLEITNNNKWSQIKDLITKSNRENIKLFFGEDFFDIKTKDDLLEIINNDKWVQIKDLIIKGNTENIKLFFGKEGIIKNLDDLDKLFNSGIYPYLFIKLDDDKLKKLFKAFNKGFNVNNIGKDFDLLFPVNSYGTKVFDEIKDLMDLEKDKDIYEILREKATNFLDTVDIEKQSNGDLDLSIYLRYNQTVNYPEIGELIIIFMQEVIKKGFIKGVKGIKILPRIKFILPKENILDENSRFCNISGADFINELTINSIPFYLSHSSNESDGLGVVSLGMEKKDGQINLGLDLEAEYDKIKTNEKTIQEIFEILTGIIKSINKLY